MFRRLPRSPVNVLCLFNLRSVFRNEFYVGVYGTHGQKSTPQMFYRILNTAWKVPVFGVFIVRIFPHLDLIRRNDEFLSVFSPNTGKYGPEEIQIRTLFMWWIMPRVYSEKLHSSNYAYYYYRAVILVTSSYSDTLRQVFCLL